MQPGLVPTDEIVTDPDDFEYVNRKISSSGVRDATARAVKYGEDASIKKESFISQSFNYAVPPPNIFEAWVRTNKGRASQGDRNKVWQYQKNHMWSPIVSEPSLPLGPLRKRALPVRDGGAAYNKRPPMQVSSLTYEEPTRSRPLCSADFEGSDDEDDISYTNIWEDAGAVRPLEDILQCPEAEMRKIQLLLQAKILREIAELVHEPGADYRLWGDAVAGWADEGDY